MCKIWFDFDFIECFTTTFLHAHSWLNWVDDDDDEDEVGLKEKPEDTRYIKKITSSKIWFILWPATTRREPTDKPKWTKSQIYNSNIISYHIRWKRVSLGKFQHSKVITYVAPSNVKMPLYVKR